LSTAEFTSRAQALAPDFVLEREIGRGGMGIVYLATDVKLERPVAIKVLPDHLAGSAEVRERFLREARTAARLTHPNVVPIYRADEMRGVVFFVMAYVGGESLADRLAARGAMPPGQTARLLRDVALALGYAHARGIVHRDVKPENILLERDTNRPLVTDFGIARLTEATPLTATGQVLGTVHYMSPEQVSGEELDGRSDLYSLGVVGFRMLSGRLPFDSATASAVLVAHVTKPAPSLEAAAPGVPRVLSDIISRCLAKDVTSRYETADALARALDEAARQLPEDGATAVAPQRIVSEREAKALWARAAELQSNTGLRGVTPRPPAPLESGNDRRTLTSGYRMTDVNAAAEEAGISSRYVQRAASELGLAPAASGPPPLTIIDRAVEANPWAGAPSNIEFEVRIPREVSDEDVEIMVDAIRRRMGEAGALGTIGRTVSWSHVGKNRKVQVSIIRRGGATTIRVDERLSPLMGGIFGGILGGGGGGMAGPAFGIGMGVFHSVAACFGLWGGAIATSYLAARGIFRVARRSREKELKSLIEELVRLSEG
jgi:serine/threonine-protein kinase